MDINKDNKELLYELRGFNDTNEIVLLPGNSINI